MRMSTFSFFKSRKMLKTVFGDSRVVNTYSRWNIAKRFALLKKKDELYYLFYSERLHNGDDWCWSCFFLYRKLRYLVVLDSKIICTKTVNMSDTYFRPCILLNFLFHRILYISLESWEPYLSDTKFIIKIRCVVVEILYNHSETWKHVNSFFAYCIWW